MIFCVHLRTFACQSLIINCKIRVRCEMNTYFFLLLQKKMATIISINGTIYIKTSYTPANFKPYTDILGNQITYDDASSDGLAPEWVVIQPGSFKLSNYALGTNQLLDIAQDETTKDLIESARWETTSTPKELTDLDIMLAKLKALLGVADNGKLKKLIMSIVYIMLIIIALYIFYKLKNRRKK